MSESDPESDIPDRPMSEALREEQAPENTVKQGGDEDEPVQLQKKPAGHSKQFSTVRLPGSCA